MDSAQRTLYRDVMMLENYNRLVSVASPSSPPVRKVHFKPTLLTDPPLTAAGVSVQKSLSTCCCISDIAF